MSDPKRPDPKRRSPTSRPGKPGEAKGRVPRAQQPPASPAAPRREPRPVDNRDDDAPTALVPVRQSITDTAEQQAEQRLAFTARRAAILAAVVCVLTLTIAGPVRTYFAQRTEMNQLAATEAALRAQIADLEGQKSKLADPVYIAAQARERLGFVMPGDIPYQVQLPPGAAVPVGPDQTAPTAKSTDPWYTALWKTIADSPHGPPPEPPAPPPDPNAPPPDPNAPPVDPNAPPPPPAVPGG